MADLTDAQLAILSAAAKRADGVLLPAPKAITKDAASVARALKSLVKHGLAAAQPTKANGAAVWRTDKQGKRYTLVLTEAGRQAIRVDDMQAAPASKQAGVTRGKPGRPATSGAKSGRKLALLTDLLRRKGGVTVDEAMKVTGWQAHSIRGAISGALRKKQGLAVAAETVEGRGRVYRVAR